jgi:hypothetical protein
MLVYSHVTGCYSLLTLEVGNSALVGYKPLLIQRNICYPSYLQAVSSSHNLRTPHVVLKAEKFTIQKFQRLKFIGMKGHLLFLQTVHRQEECITITVRSVSVIPIGSELRAKKDKYKDK